MGVIAAKNGGGTPTCSTSTDGVLTGANWMGTSADDLTTAYLATRIQLSATTTITQYDVRGFDDLSDTGSAKISLYAHDTANDGQPGTEVAGTAKTLAMTAES